MNFWNLPKIGVFGSAAGDLEKLRPLARLIGEKIARKRGILFTGGCPGLPYEAALGADEAGGLVIGISPAANLGEHINKYKFPHEPYLLIFTGQEKKGRNPISMRSCDAGIFISGRSGTLNEFTIMYDEGTEHKVMGFLAGTGGVVDNEIPSYVKRTSREKPSKTTLIWESSPEKLINRILETLKSLGNI